MTQVTAKTRTGVIAKKLGMTRIFDESGAHVPVTAFQINNTVVRVTDAEKQGYIAMQLGMGERKASRTTQPQRGHFAKASVTPKQVLQEFRVTNENLLDVGAEIGATHFIAGQFVDVTGTTVGRGFAGAMKRWNFGGLPASHGVSAKAHRSLGGTGGRQDPGKTFKNKKMHGHMGDKTRMQMNLKVVAVDEENDVIFVKGCVPGSENSWVTIRDAIKKKQPEGLQFPAGIKQTSRRADEQTRVVADEDKNLQVSDAAVEEGDNESRLLVSSSAGTSEGEQS